MFVPVSFDIIQQQLADMQLSVEQAEVRLTSDDHRYAASTALSPTDPGNQYARWAAHEMPRHGVELAREQATTATVSKLVADLDQEMMMLPQDDPAADAAAADAPAVKAGSALARVSSDPGANAGGADG